MKTLIQNRQLEACKKANIYDSKLFTGYLDSDFKDWNLEETKDAKAIKIDVCEMDKDGTFKDIFTDREAMCLTQGQILEVIKNHRDLLCKDWHTFFLFKVGTEFFVAFVRFDGGGRLRVRVHRFSFVYVWHAESGHRIVVPQLALKNSERDGDEALSS